MAVPQAVIALVIDCSVLAKWELPDEDSRPEALELFHDWQAGAVSMHAPDLLPSEIGSVFLRAVRTHRITEAEAMASIQGLLRFPYVIHDSGPLVIRAYEIARQHNQRIYDCFYVALAEREGVDLWTGDERLYNALNVDFPLIRLITGYVPLR